MQYVPIPRVLRRSLAGITGSNSAGGMDVCVVSKDKKTNCRAIRTMEQVRMKYKQSTRKFKKPGGGEISPPFQTGSGCHPASCTIRDVSKRSVRGVYHIFPSSAEVKERVQRYFYSPDGQVIGLSTLPHYCSSQLGVKMSNTTCNFQDQVQCSLQLGLDVTHTDDTCKTEKIC